MPSITQSKPSPAHNEYSQNTGTSVAQLIHEHFVSVSLLLTPASCMHILIVKATSQMDKDVSPGNRLVFRGQPEQQAHVQHLGCFPLAAPLPVPCPKARPYMLTCLHVGTTFGAWSWQRCSERKHPKCCTSEHTCWTQACLW